jgi:hypothetical protein
MNIKPNTATDSESELSELRAHIDAMLKFVPTGRGQIRAHLVWELRKMINHVTPADMTDAELAAAIAVFHAVHARVITPPTGTRPILRIIPKTVGIGSEV